MNTKTISDLNTLSSTFAGYKSDVSTALHIIDGIDIPAGTSFDDYYKYLWIRQTGNHVISSTFIADSSGNVIINKIPVQAIYKNGELLAGGATTTVAADTVFTNIDSSDDIIIIPLYNDVSTGIFPGVFSENSYLNDVIMGDAYTVLSDSCFYNCTSLSNVSLSNNIVTVGAGAFRNCEILESISLPATVTAVNQAAFAYSLIKTIDILATTAPTIYNNSLIGVQSGGQLNYPEGSDYSSWLSSSAYYLGYYNWNAEPVSITLDYTYIDLGYTVPTNTDVSCAISYQVTNINSGDYCSSSGDTNVIGSAYSSEVWNTNYKKQCVFWIFAASTRMTNSLYMCGTGSDYAGGYFTYDTDNEIVMEYVNTSTNYGNTTVTLNGTQTYTGSGNWNGNSNTISIGAGHRSNSLGCDNTYYDGWNGNITYEYVRFYESGVLVHNFVPYNDNGNACMRDTVTGSKYYPARQNKATLNY